MLDNARDVEQVRPLVPGSPGCLVAVTSRNELTGLLAQGARVLTLDPFTDGDALLFLARRLGTARVEREPAAAADLVGCARGAAARGQRGRRARRRPPGLPAVGAGRGAAQPGRGLALHGLAQLLEAQGRHAEALPPAREALRLRTAHGTPAAAASSQNALAAICERPGLPDEVVERCQRALRLCEQAGISENRARRCTTPAPPTSGPATASPPRTASGRRRRSSARPARCPTPAVTFTSLADVEAAAGDAAASRSRSRAVAAAILDALPPSDAAQVRAWITRQSEPPPAVALAADPGRRPGSGFHQNGDGFPFTPRAACQFIDSLPAGALRAHEEFPTSRLLSGLAGADGVRTPRLRPGQDGADRVGPDQVGVVTFTVAGWPAQHVAQYLPAEHGIGVRDGRFRAHPLLARLTPDGAAVRASLGVSWNAISPSWARSASPAGAG